MRKEISVSPNTQKCDNTKKFEAHVATVLRRLAGQIASRKVLVTDFCTDTLSPTRQVDGNYVKPVITDGAIRIEFACPTKVYENIVKE